MHSDGPALTSKSTWSLARWLDYLLAIHPSEIDMGLARVNTVYQRLQLSWQGCKVITVAGTNGKGSTCRFLEMSLLKLGFKVGVYSSPHIIDYRERVRINAVSPDERAFCQAFNVIERARGNETLTYFEFGTLAAIYMMKQVPLDFMILEVGLGGRLDATNIVDPDIAVITSIGIDHQEYLGDTKESVATEKAGIFRAHIPIVIGEPTPPDVLLTLAHDANPEASIKGVDFTHSVNATNNQSWCWRMLDRQLDDLPMPQLPLENISTALATLNLLGLLPQLILDDKLTGLIAETTLVGRLQTIKSDPQWIVDVAHNPHAAELLARYVTQHCKGSLYIIVGMMKDKAIAETLGWFDSLNAFWLPISLASPRAAKASELGQHLRTQKVIGEFENIKSANNALKPILTSTDTVLVFGSFVTVADVLTLQKDGGL